jgi:LysM repeat protein
VTQRKLLQLKDTSARAKKDLSPAGITRIVVQDTTDLFAIAAAYNFTAEELINLNPALDPLSVLAGTVVQLPNV